MPDGGAAGRSGAAGAAGAAEDRLLLRRPRLAAAHRDAHAVLLDRQLARIRLLEQAHETPDAPGLVVVERILVGDVGLASAQALEQRQRALAEQRDEAEILLGGGQAAGLLARLLERRLGRGGGGRPLGGRERDRVHGSRCVAPLAEQQAAHVAVHLGPAARVQHVADGLAGEDAPDRRGGRRIAALGAHAQQLVEHLVEPVLRARRAQAALDAGDDADRHRGERRAQGHVRRDGRCAGGRVAERGLDLACGLPGALAVEPGVEAEPRERLARAARRQAAWSASRRDTTRSRWDRRPRAPPRWRRRAPCRPAPARRGRRARRRPRSACG